MAILLIFTTFLSKILGFVRDVALSYFYGASEITDAYLISLTIPGTIFSFIGVGIATSYIPIYHEINEKKGKNFGLVFTNEVIKIVFLISTFLMIFILLFSEQIVTVFASGLEGESFKLAVDFTRISSSTLYFSGLIYVLKAYSEANGNYLIPAFSSLPNSLISIGGIYLSTIYSVYWMSIGSALSIFVQLLIMLPFIYKNKFSFRAKLNLESNYLNKMIYISLPVMLGVSVNQINILIDRTLASSSFEGGISIITYASRVVFFVQDLFVISIVTIMYPVISRLLIRKSNIELSRVIEKTFAFINILLVPSMLISFIYSEEIVRILYGRGEFTQESIFITSSVLRFYSLGMLFYGWKEILVRGFYGSQDTKTPTINSMISTISNIILSVVLVNTVGIIGLPIATTLSSILLTMLLFVKFSKKIIQLPLNLLFIDLLKVFVASGLAIYVSDEIYNYLDSLNIHLSITFSILAFSLVNIYVISLVVLKVNNVKSIMELIKNKFGSWWRK
ncbi:murein biosynthesis integral membrane protein MurJ [Exiguobacterium aurantiacum]|uniref:murein biosynthesis integral membrane protein MurJ n=1 Tax=Exiguobacterium aurantiacum TaxID=33987 RepID=UPI001E446F85|nr:murein biosynthesis integral membrane protein MurJ [Exiguobacterium aurantiacum]